MIDEPIAKPFTQRSVMSLASHKEIDVMALYIPYLQALFWNDYGLIKPIREGKSGRQGLLQRLQMSSVLVFQQNFAQNQRTLC